MSEDGGGGVLCGPQSTSDVIGACIDAFEAGGFAALTGVRLRSSEALA